jgi:hypothetical protein
MAWIIAASLVTGLVVPPPFRSLHVYMSEESAAAAPARLTYERPRGTEEYEGANLRERMVIYMRKWDSNIGCYAMYYPEMVAAFEAANVKAPEKTGVAAEFAQMTAGKQGSPPDGQVPLQDLMRITGEELSDTELTELLALVSFPAGRPVGFEKWTKIMMDTVVATARPKEEKKGFFGLF